MTTYGPFITRAQAKAQGLKQYFDGKPCKHGHVDARLVSNWVCMECARANSRLQHKAKSDDPSYKARQAAKTRAWRAENYERSLSKVSECNRRRYASDSGYRAQKLAAQRKPARRAHLRAYEKAKRASDPSFRFKQAMRSMLANRLKGANDGKGGRSSVLFGCPIEELRIHLEAQFAEGMTWDNYGRWHVDHIRPCASFDLTDKAQQRECFHFTNLQPLWALDNIRKSDTWEPIAA